MNVLEVFSELNLAVFYLRGTYYEGVRRMLRIRHVCVLFIKSRSGLYLLCL